MDTLEIVAIGFEAGGRQILRDVSLSVAPGETVALLGPSGSGKTTLLRMVAGLDRPSSGSIRFAGAEVTAIPAHRRGFGMMFQDHALFPHLDVAGNVDFGLKQSGWDARQRVERRCEVLDVVGLAGFEQRTIEKLSGGERQRVALARALAPQPRLLMLDEPLGSLDRGLRERLSSDLRGILRSLGVPALYVTHDQFEAFTVAHRLAILNEGRVVRAGTPREIWDEPRTEFVARFLGMDNIVPADAFPALSPASGEPSAPLLLLRNEGVELGVAAGPNVVSGPVESVEFRGEATEVRIAAAGLLVSFSFPSGIELPAAGDVAHVFIPVIQSLQPGDGALL